MDSQLETLRSRIYHGAWAGRQRLTGESTSTQTRLPLQAAAPWPEHETSQYLRTMLLCRCREHTIIEQAFKTGYTCRSRHMPRPRG